MKMQMKWGKVNEHEEGICQDGEMNQEEGEHSKQIDHHNTDEAAPHSTTVPEKSRQTTTESTKSILTSSTVKHAASGYKPTENPDATSSQGRSVKKTSPFERTPRTVIRKRSK